MSKTKTSFPSLRQRGFTLIELLVIAPILLLFIAGFIGTAVTLVGSVLASNASSTMTYNIQDALNRIESDVKQSGAFLSVNNLTITAPQGYNSDTTNFENAYNSVSGTPNTNFNTGDPNDPTGAMLILNAYATTTNPVNLSNLTPIPAAGEPNACGSMNVSQNTLTYVNIVYFVRNGSLWRRIIVPPNYPAIGCSVPWQQASCASGYSNTFCKTNDIDLVNNVPAGGFSVNYYPTASSTTPNTVANNPSNSDAIRGGTTGLLAVNTVGVSITASTVISGRTVTQTGSIRATSINNDVSSTANGAAPVISTAPASQTVSSGASVTFSAVAAPSTNASYQWQQSPDGGTTWTNIPGATAISYTITSASTSMSGSQYRIVVSDIIGSTTSSAATLTVTSSGWSTCTLQNGWSDYGNSTNNLSTSGFRKNSKSGMVVLKGTITRIGQPVRGETICTLPYDYRPSEDIIFQTTVLGTNATANVGIYTDGTIRYVSSQSYNTGISLDGINFLPTSAGSTWTNITLASPWQATGSPYAVPAWTVDPAGVVHLKGVLQNGSSTVNMTSSLPTAAQPGINAGIIFGSDGSDSFDDIAVKNDGTIYPAPGITGGDSSYETMQAMYMPSSFWAWTSLSTLNSWTSYGAGYAPAEYTKTTDGMVMMQGMIAHGTITAGTLIATLPAGDRPLQTEVFATPSNSTSAALEVFANGNIVILNGVNNSWLSLTPIQFYAEQ